MNLTPIILSILLAGSALGYGMQASAQNPCTASQPCAPICGNHPCAPGETYTPGMLPSGNQTGMPSIANQVSASANATATKTTNGTMPANMTMGGYTHHHGNMTGYMGNGTMMQGNMTGMYMHHHHGNMTGSMANGTMTGNMNSMPMASNLQSPRAQVAAGTQPTNVKCMSGFYLVISNSDSSPACVTQSTASLLEARNWGHAAS
ncbi:MAG: hypothetical protein WCC52_08370 [Nitrosotalea sp.]